MDNNTGKENSEDNNSKSINISRNNDSSFSPNNENKNNNIQNTSGENRSKVDDYLGNFDVNQNNLRNSKEVNSKKEFIDNKKRKSYEKNIIDNKTINNINNDIFINNNFNLNYNYPKFNENLNLDPNKNRNELVDKNNLNYINGMNIKCTNLNINHFNHPQIDYQEQKQQQLLNHFSKSK